MSTQEIVLASICVVVIVNLIGFGTLYLSKKQSKKK